MKKLTSCFCSILFLIIVACDDSAISLANYKSKPSIDPARIEINTLSIYNNAAEKTQITNVFNATPPSEGDRKQSLVIFSKGFEQYKKLKNILKIKIVPKYKFTPVEITNLAFFLEDTGKPKGAATIFFEITADFKGKTYNDVLILRVPDSIGPNKRYADPPAYIPSYEKEEKNTENKPETPENEQEGRSDPPPVPKDPKKIEFFSVNLPTYGLISRKTAYNEFTASAGPDLFNTISAITTLVPAAPLDKKKVGLQSVKDLLTLSVHPKPSDIEFTDMVYTEESNNTQKKLKFTVTSPGFPETTLTLIINLDSQDSAEPEAPSLSDQQPAEEDNSDSHLPSIIADSLTVIAPFTREPTIPIPFVRNVFKGNPPSLNKAKQMKSAYSFVSFVAKGNTDAITVEKLSPAFTDEPLTGGFTVALALQAPDFKTTPVKLHIPNPEIKRSIEAITFGQTNEIRAIGSNTFVVVVDSIDSIKKSILDGSFDSKLKITKTSGSTPDPEGLARQVLFDKDETHYTIDEGGTNYEVSIPMQATHFILLPENNEPRLTLRFILKNQLHVDSVRYRDKVFLYDPDSDRYSISPQSEQEARELLYILNPANWNENGEFSVAANKPVSVLKPESDDILTQTDSEYTLSLSLSESSGLAKTITISVLHKQFITVEYWTLKQLVGYTRLSYEGVRHSSLNNTFIYTFSDQRYLTPFPRTITALEQYNRMDSYFSSGQFKYLHLRDVKTNSTAYWGSPGIESEVTDGSTIGLNPGQIGKRITLSLTPKGSDRNKYYPATMTFLLVKPVVTQP